MQLGRQTTMHVGGTKGIGKACVEELAALGAKVHHLGSILLECKNFRRDSICFNEWWTVLLAVTDSHSSSTVWQVVTCGRNAAELKEVVKSWRDQGLDAQALPS